MAEFPRNQCIVFTGRLASMSRAMAVAQVVELGGLVRHSVTTRTDFVVMGADGWPMRSCGRLTRNLELTEELDRCGHHIAILSEAEFLRRLRRDEQATSIRHSHTLEQLSRLVGISGLRLRRWVQRGLIRPVDPQATIALFDYGEVTAAAMLAKLIARGARPTTLVRSLQSLQRWLPEDATVTDHLVRLQRELLIRDHTGQLINASGQLHFDFSESSTTSLQQPVVDVLVDPDELYDLAYRYDSQGDFAHAIELYREWLNHFGEDADVLFNLGNSYCSSGEHAQAAVAYRRCLQADRRHTDAWNNLGLCLSELNEPAAAVKALRQAVLVEPANLQARENLAELLK